MFEFVDKIIASLGENPYFNAGFGLVGVGAGIAAGRKALVFGSIVFRRHCLMTMEITHRDQSYPWVLNWINHKHTYAQHLSVDTQVHHRESGQFSCKFDFTPSVGTHFFRIHNRWMKLERERQQAPVGIGHPFETIKFTCLGRDKEIFNHMLDEARDLELSKVEGKTVIYLPRIDKWEPSGEPRQRRQFESVILDNNIAERVLSDVQEFLGSKDWYSRRGVPYRRGYLLHGPPGCGKTSYITALAGRLQYDICQLNLSNTAFADDQLSYLLNVAPRNSIILLEDIDAAFTSREDIDTTKPAFHGLGKVTLSGILNVLDGVGSTEERILFMTTNYPERLDPALTRPGRVDMRFYIGYASQAQLARAFERFYPDAPEGVDGNLFAESIEEAKKKFKLPKRKRIDLSMADVQSYLLLYKDKPEEAIGQVNELLAMKLASSDSSAQIKDER